MLFLFCFGESAVFHCLVYEAFNTDIDDAISRRSVYRLTCVPYIRLKRYQYLTRDIR